MALSCLSCLHIIVTVWRRRSILSYYVTSTGQPQYYTILYYTTGTQISIAPSRQANQKRCERVVASLRVLVFKCKHSLAPAYLSEQLQQVAQLESRQRLRSSSSSAFVVSATRRSTLGDRSFSAAGTRAWNSLPPTVTAASTLSSFRRYLKSHLFTKSFPSWR